MKKITFITAVTLAVGTTLTAQNWSQWRGTNRDAIAKTNTNLNFDWENNPPKLSWVFREAGAGYSSPVVVGNTIYMSGAANDEEFAFALDTRTGHIKWKQILGKQFTQDHGSGPRGTMVVDNDKLYLIRADGQLHCLSISDGKILWKKDFVNDFNGVMSTVFGYSESPLIDDNHLICTPGGVNGSMVALNKNTGEKIWQSKELLDSAAYSSPLVAEIGGVRQYIQLTAGYVVGVAANDGKLLWRTEVPGASAMRAAAIIPTPIFFDKNKIFVTTGFGSFLVRLDKNGPDFNPEIVYNNKNMVNNHGGVVLLNDHIYGFGETSGWTCLDVKSGERSWAKRGVGIARGALFAINDRLILQDEATGRLVVIAASTDDWTEIGRMELPERTEILTLNNMVWTHPVFANGKLYVRDQDLLFCFDLTK
jgi:outer membrane protein assembly factor BamB